MEYETFRGTRNWKSWKQSGLKREPVTAACILKNLKTRNTWALSSLMTALARLTEKGFVCCDRKYRHNLYTALIGEEDYKAYQGRTLLDRLYGSSVTKMVANLVRKEKLSREGCGDSQRVSGPVENKGE